MAYQILEKESIDITHIDQAVLHNFIANNQSGIIGGYANECSLTSMGNTLIISTGMLLINGVRVKISEVESVVLSSTPTQDTTYQLIAQLTIDSNQAPSFEFIARTPQALIKHPIGQDGGVGVYQLELARFAHATDGTIKNIVRTANVLYGATNVDLNEIRASVQDARSQAQAVYGLASNAVATSAAAQATAQEAKQIAQQAQEDVRGIEINVAEERGTVVTVNGQPKAQVEWNDKLDKTEQLVLGETSDTAYRGDRGKIAYDHSQEIGNPHQTKFEDVLEKPTTLDGYGITGIDASKITSGVFDVARIPDLSASKITSGVFDAERIPYNKILYEDTHDFIADGDFYPSNFEFEIGSTYALEIRVLGGVKTEILTFVPASAGYAELSFISWEQISSAIVKLIFVRLRVYANRITTSSTVGIEINHQDGNIRQSSLSYLSLQRVIKLR